ncbi:MAG: DUF115 domain-containing protein, partial [Treponema sp.]|nr:DUF115 domain-containing protein [Treponema sp.]
MIYSENILSKTGEKIPLFTDKKPMHSKYNPHAERISENAREGFYLIGGIGGSYHLESLLNQLGGESFVLAVEADRESLDFSLGSGVTTKVKNDERIQFCTLDELPYLLKQLYLPVLYSSFYFLAQRSWEDHAGNAAESIKKAVEDTLPSISADYSVQAHFGKQWQGNIIKNLSRVTDCPAPFIPSGKTACVIAAGPSLDRSIGKLKEELDSCVVFCTDTACQILRKHSVEPDYIVSIDCQKLSLEHFMQPASSTGGKKATVILDLGSSPDIAKFVESQGHKVYFTSSLHPLSKMASEEFNLPLVRNGSGTVAIAACDIARLCGAKKIRLYGADFSYSGGKAYARGTYLDSIYGRESGRTCSSETFFNSLMFRTELRECRPLFSADLENPRTSDVLDSYSNALCSWAEENSYKHERDCLILKGQAES